MTNEQMELGLGGQRRSTVKRQGRLNRGRWWFEQMRRVVDGALGAQYLQELKALLEHPVRLLL